MAPRLDDGTTDNTLYDTREDAVRGQGAAANDHWYWQIAPDGVTAGEAGYGVVWARRCHAAGLTESQRDGQELDHAPAARGHRRAAAPAAAAQPVTAYGWEKRH